MKSTEEFGQALQNIIDRHRQDLSILLPGDLVPADIVVMYKQHPEEVALTLAQLPLDDDLCHFEGESLVDKVVNFLDTGLETFRAAKDKTDSPTTTTSVQPAPEPRPSRTHRILIAGLVLAAALVVVLILIKRRRK